MKTMGELEKQQRTEAYIRLLHFMLKHNIREHVFDDESKLYLMYHEKDCDQDMRYIPQKLYFNNHGQAEMECYYPYWATKGYHRTFVSPEMYPPECGVPAKDIDLIIETMKNEMIKNITED